MQSGAVSPLAVTILICALRGVGGTVTVSGSGGTGIPNQQALTLRCSYTVSSGVVTEYAWKMVEVSSTVTIASGSVTAQTVVFQDSWQNKGVFVGDYTSSLDIQLPASDVTSSHAGTYRCEVNTLSESGYTDVTASVLTPPSISGIPATQTATEFSNLRIDCSTYTTPGNPPTTNYTWTYDGSTVSTGAVLDRRNISRSQGGDYTCTASNSQGSDSASVSVAVQYPPSISGIPATQNVTEFSNLRIDCSTFTTPGNPPTTNYRWTYGGSTVSSGAVLDRRNIRRSQGGDYTCNASNSQGSDLASVSVDVLSPPSISGLPPAQTVTEFSNLNINCSTFTTPGNPPTTSYRWTYGGSTVSTGSVLDRRNINRSQTGDYNCTASNSQGSASASVNVDVQYGPGTSVTITPSGSLKRVEGSGAFTATCTAVCNPNCNITWRKDNSDLLSGQISISNVSRIDQGDYTCQAQNGIGAPQQKSLTLVVYYLDSPHLTFNKSEVMENTTVTVACDVDSNPTVEMTVTNVDNTVLVQKNTNTLNYTIQRAQCLHNGSFMCSADNRKTGTVHQTTQSLSVLCSPRHDFRKQLNTVVAQGKYSTAYLTADIIANPLPNFTWYRQDGGSVSPIRNSTGITVISTGLKSILQINITSDDDYGEYAVDVQNSVGQKRIVFNLISKTPPSAPSSLQLYLVGTTSVSLQWVSAFNGGSNQTFTVKYKSQSQSQWTTGKSGIADPGKGKQVQGTVTGLKPLNSYTFQVFGSNIYGEGEMTIIQGTTLEEQEESINIPAMGGGIGASLLVILIIVVVLVILHKRGVLLKSRDENQDAELFEGRSQEEPEIQENCIYETSDNKTVVVKKKAAVQKEDIYAKTERKGKANVSRDMKKARKPARERRNREDVYENTVIGQNFAYGNAGYESREGDNMTECLNGRDKDGLLYVGIDFGNNPPSQIIHRAEESTEYAAIAIGEVGPPTPPDEYEQQNGRHNASAI